MNGTICQVHIYQVLVRYARFFSLLLEIVDGVSVEPDGDLLLQLKMKQYQLKVKKLLRQKALRLMRLKMLRQRQKPESRPAATAARL